MIWFFEPSRFADLLHLDQDAITNAFTSRATIASVANYFVLNYAIFATNFGLYNFINQSDFAAMFVVDPYLLACTALYYSVLHLVHQVRTVDVTSTVLVVTD